MPHHRLVDEKHHHTGDLCQNGGDAQLYDQVEFLSASEGFAVPDIPQQHITLSLKNFHWSAKLVFFFDSANNLCQNQNHEGALVDYLSDIKKRAENVLAVSARLIYPFNINNYQPKMSEFYFFSMVFSNRNPEIINVANANKIVVFIFLPFLIL
jgi:hypothetical protein